MSGHRIPREDRAIATQQRSKPVALITEDSPDTRMVLRRLAEKQGFDVIEAADGEAGVGPPKSTSRT